MTYQHKDGEARATLAVLKFGSSVLESEEDCRIAAQEVYRHIRKGEKVVAVVSALAGETDALLAQSVSVGGQPPAAMVARLARTGELKSAALMGLALCRIGVRTAVLDPHEIGLTAEGEPLDANLTALDAAAVTARFDDNDAVVLPGFVATHAEHGIVTLGRGGTDLSAVFLAARLGARHVRLLKDVDGVYSSDPARHPDAERYGTLDYESAMEVSNGLVQPKAIEAARQENIVIEVAAVSHGEATLIGALPTHKEPPVDLPSLKVALLGCGSVGSGVLAYLEQRPELFHLNPVLVRDPGRRADARPGRYTADPEEALAGDPDLVIELLGGNDFATDLMCRALRGGSHVVTANKAAVAGSFEMLHACARAGGGSIRFSAAVGGGTPAIESVHRLGANSGVAAIEGVMNGTANFLLSRLGEGMEFEAALARAQELGLAEADPTADIEGRDAADKLSLLVREAFGAALPPARIASMSLREVTPERAVEMLDQGKVFKQVGRCRRLADGGVAAEVTVEPLPLDHPLAGARDEENRFLITDGAGVAHTLYGKGAGRWPSAAAVFADIMDLEREIARASIAQASLRLSA